MAFLRGLTAEIRAKMAPMGMNLSTPTEEQAIEAVTNILRALPLDLPDGHWDEHEFDEHDPPECFVRIVMSSDYDLTLYPDGFALCDGGEVSPGEAALDILALLALFAHYQRFGLTRKGSR